MGVTAVLVAAALTAYGAYRNVLGNIHRVNVSGLLGNRPPELTSAMNILVIGSDTRAGSGGKYGSAKLIQGARSDTMLMLHILPHAGGAVVVSFPRDSEVPILSCKADGVGDPGQRAQPGSREMLNATFAYGGAPCVWKTVESVTGVYINHFMQIDFNGFQSVVNDLGGVNVCLPKAVNDPASGLRLTAGVHHVNGRQALAFVRERHIGQGSDLQRIQRQQFFMAAVVQEAESSKVLSNPAKLYGIASDASKSLTTDKSLSLSTMISAAESMRGQQANKVQFLQVPVSPDPNNASRVIWQQPQASQLFGEIAHDQAVSGNKKPSAKPSASSTPAASPSHVRVAVLNGTGRAGLAAQTATALTKRHFTVTSTGNATASSASTIIKYGTPAGASDARALQKVLPDARVQRVPGIRAGTVDLVLGSDFTGLAGSSPGGQPSSHGSRNFTKTYGGITGGANICKDSKAFTGPDVPSDFGR